MRECDHCKIQSKPTRNGGLPPVLRPCEQCGKQFQAVRPSHRFCQTRCRNRALYLRARPLSVEEAERAAARREPRVIAL